MNNERIQDLIDSFLEITLESDDDFLVCKETLTRIGISSNKEKILYQSCHILHKRGKYYIVHFKELFGLDNKAPRLDESDLGRRNTIAKLLHEWGLCKIVGASNSTDNLTGDNVTQYPTKMDVLCSINKIKILSHKDKFNWELKEKYPIAKYC